MKPVMKARFHMKKRNIIRVRPITFETDWRADMASVGIQAPPKVPETSYTPVNHYPMPYSLAVDLEARRVVRRIVGVMPNAVYQGHIYRWDEFCELIGCGRPGEEKRRKQT